MVTVAHHCYAKCNSQFIFQNFAMFIPTLTFAQFIALFTVIAVPRGGTLKIMAHTLMRKFTVQLCDAVDNHVIYHISPIVAVYTSQ